MSFRFLLWGMNYFLFNCSGNHSSTQNVSLFNCSENHSSTQNVSKIELKVGIGVSWTLQCQQLPGSLWVPYHKRCIYSVKLMCYPQSLKLHNYNTSQITHPRPLFWRTPSGLPAITQIDTDYYYLLLVFVAFHNNKSYDAN